MTADTERVFAALREGFEQGAPLGALVMTVTLSNTCPADEQ